MNGTIMRDTYSETGGFQPLALHDEGGDAGVIRVARRITYGKVTVICWGDFWIARICNRMDGSHDGYSLKIVIVMSDMAVFPHGHIALNTCT